VREKSSKFIPKEPYNTKRVRPNIPSNSKASKKGRIFKPYGPTITPAAI